MTHLFRIVFVAFLTFGMFVTSVSAHEFWINPRKFQEESGSRIIASFRNGENFKGTDLAFFDRSSTRLQVVAGGKVMNLKPRNGDRPAIKIDPVGDGLIILAHESTPSGLTYKTWAKFAKFAKHKNFNGIEAKHKARGLPRENFKEGYTRHAKALMAVGNGAGKDRNLGMETEFVALTNPYAAGYGQVMQVKLFYKGKPRADAQVEVFEKSSNGKVKISLTRTDGNGVARIKTRPGRSYLLDAVVIRDPVRGVKNVAWETIWASLTFATP